jgi:hypothetical protein
MVTISDGSSTVWEGKANLHTSFDQNGWGQIVGESMVKLGEIVNHKGFTPRKRNKSK